MITKDWKGFSGSSVCSVKKKKEMLEDAHSEARRKIFAQARSQQFGQRMAGPEYVRFLQSVQKIFSHPISPHNIKGDKFRI
jgi:hypothetical protein